jgi:hypothetical protein
MIFVQTAAARAQSHELARYRICAQFYVTNNFFLKPPRTSPPHQHPAPLSFCKNPTHSATNTPTHHRPGTINNVLWHLGCVVWSGWVGGGERGVPDRVMGLGWGFMGSGRPEEGRGPRSAGGERALLGIIRPFGLRVGLSPAWSGPAAWEAAGSLRPGGEGGRAGGGLESFVQ